MSKFHGAVGFINVEEVSPGVWKEITSERNYSGEILSNNNRFVGAMTQSLYDNLAISNQISIIADPYMNEHFPSIKYVEFKGAKWRVTNVDASKYPRFILSLGEVYTDVEQT